MAPKYKPPSPTDVRAANNPDGIKKGRLSAEEKNFIASTAKSWTPEAIAKKMRRSVGQIADEIARHTGVAVEPTISLVIQLQERPEWRQFQKQFSDDELEEFKHQYVQIMSQLKDQEVFATEELQIFQVITLKILIDRTLTEQKMALDDMNAAHANLEELRKKGGAAKRDEIDYNEIMYENAKRTNKDCADRYKIYSDKQDKMLTALKATRDQRVKVWENSKTSILGWLRNAMEEDQRRLMGDEAEMMRIASEKEKERLARPYRFPDGTIDQPLYTPETAVIDLEENGFQKETVEDTGLE